MTARSTLPWSRLVGLSLGFGLAGWLLTFYQATPVIWMLTELMVSYLAWVGTGAIALSSVGAIAMIWIATLLTPQPDPLADISLTPAQTWALSLICSLTLALSLIFGLANTVQQFTLAGWGRRLTWTVLIVLANLGLLGGILIKVAFFHS